MQLSLPGEVSFFDAWLARHASRTLHAKARDSSDSTRGRNARSDPVCPCDTPQQMLSWTHYRATVARATYRSGLDGREGSD